MPHRDPRDAARCETFDDGAVAFADGTILADRRRSPRRPRATDADADGPRPARLRPAPGLVDTHVHYPQIPVIGAMGLELLDWLAQRTLPEEAKMADPATRARPRSASSRLLAAQRHDVRARVRLATSRTPRRRCSRRPSAAGLRIASGLVVSDRNLRPELEVTPERGLRASRELLERWHGHGRLRYAVTPRF